MGASHTPAAAYKAMNIQVILAVTRAERVLSPNKLNSLYPRTPLS